MPAIALDHIVPISDFDNGDTAEQILDSVEDYNPVLVVSGDRPAAVIVTARQYEEMCELIKDFSADDKPVDDGSEPERD